MTYREFLKNIKDSYRRRKHNYYKRSIINVSWNGKIFFNNHYPTSEKINLNKSIDVLYKWYDSLYSYTSFPKAHQRKLHTNNVTERFNKELKRRTKKIGAFPNNVH